MLDPARFIADCEAAVVAAGGQKDGGQKDGGQKDGGQKDGGQKAVRELMARAVSDRADVVAGLGEPKRAGIELLHRSSAVTVLNLIWGPRMTVMPHNHHMWAVIGIYGGREDNIFWRVLPPDARWPIEAAGAASLMPGEACVLGKDIIHSVTNPLGRLTAAIHVYGGDFLKQEREEWHEETLVQAPYDQAKARRLFEESNRGLA
jgi:predicted metal-dependent enzyme (double-stranded beta helix superfamily)